MNIPILKTLSAISFITAIVLGASKIEYDLFAEAVLFVALSAVLALVWGFVHDYVINININIAKITKD